MDKSAEALSVTLKDTTPSLQGMFAYERTHRSPRARFYLI